MNKQKSEISIQILMVILDFTSASKS